MTSPLQVSDYNQVQCRAPSYRELSASGSLTPAMNTLSLTFPSPDAKLQPSGLQTCWDSAADHSISTTV